MVPATRAYRIKKRATGVRVGLGGGLLAAFSLSYSLAAWARAEEGVSGGGASSASPPLALKASISLREVQERRQVRRKPAVDPLVPRLKLAVEFSEGAKGNVAPPRTAVSPESVSAAITIDEPEPPLPFDAVKPGPSGLSPAAAQEKEDKLPSFSLVEGWAIPPIRWGGNTASTLNWTNNSDGFETTTNTNLLNFRASSYVYQPWYAQVSGDLGLAQGENNSSGKNFSTRSTSTSTNYGGNLNLFPQSRFPFQAFVQQTNSRAQMSSSSTQTEATRFGVRQNYRPEVGTDSYAGTYDHSVVSSGITNSVVDNLSGAFNGMIHDQRINLNGNYSETTGDLGGQGSKLLNLQATHNWSESQLLSVSSSASFMDNQVQAFSSGGSIASNNTQLIQMNSAVSWIPDEELPITVSGGGNFLNMSNSSGLTDARLTNFLGYLNANYRVSNQLYVTGGATVSQIQNSQFSQFSSAQNASFSYTGTPLAFGDYSYLWTLGGAGHNQFTTKGNANRGISGQAQHSLNRHFLLSETSSVGLNVGESVSASGGGQSQSTTLTHSGGAFWNQRLAGGAVGSFSLNASDTLVSGDYASHYRNASLQGNMQMPLTGRSAITASANFVVSEQVKAPQSNDSGPSAAQINLNGNRTMNGSGSVTYTHRNIFGVQNLFYGASLLVNMTQSNYRVVSGDPNANSWQTSQVFQQNLSYRIGRLVFTGTASVAQQDGKENASVFLMMNRDFGGY